MPRLNQAGRVARAGDGSDLAREHRGHCGKVRRHVQVNLLVVGFYVRSHVLVTQPQVERYGLGGSPVVLRKEVPGVGVEQIIFRAELDRGLLGKAEQEIGQGRDTRSGAREHECSAGVAGVVHGVRQPAKVSAPCPRVLAPGQTHGIADGIGVVGAERRRQIL